MTSTTARRGAASLLLLAYLGFISLGLPDALLGVAWPSIRGDFGRSQAAIGAILIGGSVGYFLSSFSTGTLLRRLGVGRLLALSTLLVTVALLGYANAPFFPLVVASAALLGLGSGAIDAGLNNHAANSFSARHMNWLHACWGLGATLGPLLMTTVLTNGQSWRVAYLIVAALLGAMTLAFARTHRLWQGDAHADGSVAATVTMGEALRHPLVPLHLLLFFLYTGIEAGAGAWAFTLLSEGRGLPLYWAGLFTSLYWASLTVGRVSLGMIVDRVGPERLLRLCMVGVLAGALLLLVGRSPAPSAAGLMLFGLSLAPIFPGMMSETPRRLGQAVGAHAVGFQVSTAVLGAATIPTLIGIAATRLDSLEVVAIFLASGALALALIHELIVHRARPA